MSVDAVPRPDLTDYLLPTGTGNAEDAEKSVLGAMLLEDQVAVVAADILTPDDFYNKKLRDTFVALVDRVRRGETVTDTVLVRDDLMRRGIVDQSAADGFLFLGDLISRVPNAANAERYANIVKEAAARRVLKEAAAGLIEDAYEGVPLIDLLSRITRVADRITVANTEDRQYRADQLVSLCDDAAGERVTTGYMWLDELVDSQDKKGWRSGSLVVVGGIPGAGKTAWMIDSMRRQAEAGIPVALFSYEMTASELGLRLIASCGARAALVGLSDQITVDDAGGRMENLYLRILAGCKLRGWRAVYVDYLQLIPCGSPRDNRNQAVGGCANALKNLARITRVPIITASSLNRDFTGQPGLKNLRESGDIEFACDYVLFMHPDRGRGDIVQVQVEKNRHGAAGGRIEAHLLADRMRIEL